MFDIKLKKIEKIHFWCIQYSIMKIIQQATPCQNCTHFQHIGLFIVALAYLMYTIQVQRCWGLSDLVAQLYEHF